jgi:Spy/CpxP family protein refolding chaperone
VEREKTAFQKAVGMNMSGNRFAKRVTVAAGLCFLCVAPGLTLGQSAAPTPTQTPNAAGHGAQQKGDSQPPDYFAGLSYTDEQKAEIDQIRQEIKAHRDLVAKDDKLTADQKDAMLLGYTRMENARVYKVLTPEQQRQVRQRVLAHRAAEEAKKKPAPQAAHN